MKARVDSSPRALSSGKLIISRARCSCAYINFGKPWIRRATASPPARDLPETGTSRSPPWRFATHFLPTNCQRSAAAVTGLTIASCPSRFAIFAVLPGSRRGSRCQTEQGGDSTTKQRKSSKRGAENRDVASTNGWMEHRTSKRISVSLAFAVAARP